MNYLLLSISYEQIESLHKHNQSPFFQGLENAVHHPFCFISFQDTEPHVVSVDRRKSVTELIIAMSEVREKDLNQCVCVCVGGVGGGADTR